MSAHRLGMEIPSLIESAVESQMFVRLMVLGTMSIHTPNHTARLIMDSPLVIGEMPPIDPRDAE